MLLNLIWWCTYTMQALQSKYVCVYVLVCLIIYQPTCYLSIYLWNQNHVMFESLGSGVRLGVNLGCTSF